MKFDAKFVISLSLIIVVSWADVFFLGMIYSAAIPSLLKHILHICAYLFTFWAGYIFFKNHALIWLPKLWFIGYSSVLFLFLFVLGVYTIFHGLEPNKFLYSIISIRNIFIGPLPFLFGYILSLVSQQGSRAKKNNNVD